MGNELRGTGNLGESPTLKTVTVKGEDRQVAEMRVFLDDYKQDGQGGFEQNGGFWLNVSTWDKLAESVAKHLRKGARVNIAGHLTEQEWTDKESGEVRKSMQLNANEVYLALSRLDEVKFKAKIAEVAN